MDENRSIEPVGGFVKWISGFISISFAGILVLSLNSKALGNKRIKVIYGRDDRLDVYQVSDPGLINMASSTAALISKTKLKIVNQDVVIDTKVYGDDLGLCKDEPFFSQTRAARCSGFLVAPDLFVTAGHCVSMFDCADNAVVFNFKMDGPGKNPSSVSVNDVYMCKRVVAREQTPEQDYSLIQLDRPVVGHRPAALAQTQAKVGDALTLIGHPSGLPTKIAGGANVRKVEKGYFVANTDSFGGNSGSAVFNAADEVQGILVRGDEDFKFDIMNMCTRSVTCADAKCRGEDATHIGFIVNALKAMPAMSQLAE